MPRRNRFERTRVHVVLVNDVHLQDVAGPVQVLDEASRLGGGYRIAFCSASKRVRSAQGLVLADLESLGDVGTGDLVLVPGTYSNTIDRVDAPLDWLRAAAAKGARIASVCSGAFVLARAGLLDGRRCTTHWNLIEKLRADHPKARVLENRLFVEDGNLITSAGVASGIDMALAIVEEDYGPLVVARVAREMVVYLRRAGDAQQRSVYLDHRTHLHPGVHRVQDYIVAHPETKLTLGELGHIAGMSPRNLARVFKRATSLTPKQFVSKVKLQVARDLVADPERTVDAIASSCGFEDARQLRRLWKEAFGVSIRTFREQVLDTPG